MCGLFGAKSNTYLSKLEKENFQKLAVYSSFRGWHSTGVAIGSWKKKKQIDISIKKGVLAPWNFFNTKEVDDAVMAHGKFLLLGHNRSATIGSVTHDNAHPYWEGPIVGAHNGTVNAFNPSDATKSTDSRELIKFLAENDIKETVKKAEYGAFALTWTDRRDGSFNMCRNDRRPLWVAADVGQGTMYWASTEAILNHMIVEADNGDKFTQPWELKEFIHYKFALDEIEPDEFDVKPPVKTWVPMGPWRNQGERGVNNDDPPFSVAGRRSPAELKELAAAIKARRDAKAKEEADKVKVTVDNPEMEAYRGFSFKILPIAKAKYLLSEGCAHCTTKHRLNDKVWWYSEEDHVCDRCTEHTLVREIVGYGNKIFEGIYMTKLPDMKKEQKYRIFVNNNRV